MAALMCCTWFVRLHSTLVGFWRGEILMAKAEDIAPDIMSARKLGKLGEKGEM